MRVYWNFIRPFTLLVPALGMLTGALIAWGAAPRAVSNWSDSTAGTVVLVLGGALMAACLNAYSNGINQIYDLEVDRINKPGRPLPSGLLSRREAWVVSLVFLTSALGLAWAVNWQCALMAVSAAFLTTIYSAPPLRTKARGMWANITISIPRGTLLIVAGWSCVKDIFSSGEPWIIGSVFGLFFLGAATTKDFSDIEGDRRGGCRTLPVIYGVRKAVRIVSPFFVLPFLILPAAALAGWLSADRLPVAALGIALALWGGYIVSLLTGTAAQTASPSQGAVWENHPSWRHMYLLTLAAQVGLSVSYLMS